MCKNKQRQSYEAEDGRAAAAVGQKMADHEHITSVRIDTQLGTDYRELRHIGQVQL